MTAKESAQTRRTKQHIKTTFLALMAEHGFENLTVVMIVTAADINRGTFYRHYQDKYQLLEEIEDALFDKYVAIIEEKLPINLHRLLQQQEVAKLEPFLYEEIVIVINFFYEHQEIMRLLLGGNGDPTFIRKIENTYIEMVKTKVAAVVVTETKPYYETLFFLSGIISVVEEWLLIEGKETPEEIAWLLAKAFFKTPMEMIGLK